MAKKRGRPPSGKEAGTKAIVEQIEKSIQKKQKTKKGIEFVSTGSTWLDLALGGGLPFGKVVSLAGEYSTGKTLIACEAVFQAIQKYGEKVEYFYDNGERGLTFDTKQLYGYSFQGLEESSSTVEEFQANIDRKIKNKKPENKFIYIEDSIDGLGCQQEEQREAERISYTLQGKKFDKGSFEAEKAKFISRFFRIFKDKLVENDCLLLLVSQLRDNMDSSFIKDKKSGGRAIGFYASQDVRLKKVETTKKKDIPIGIVVQAEVRKNKVGKPFRKAYIHILFDYGIDNVTGNVEYLFDLRTEGGRGRNRIDAEWDGKPFKSKEALVDYIEKNSQEELLDNMVRAKWAEFEKSIAPKRKKKY
jgi:recombination protein RecA